MTLICIFNDKNVTGDAEYFGVVLLRDS
jgi:hypothetical protein